MTPSNQPTSDSHPLPETSLRLAGIAHIVPFAAWMILMSLLGYVGDDHAWKYAVRTGLCAALFLALRPWRWYAGPQLKNLPWAVGAGVLVYAIWVFPEMIWGDSMPRIQIFYQRFLVRPLGEFPAADLLPNGKSMYDPLVCGWPLSLIRLGGSAFVIAVIEEFFFRGFLYRWVIDRDFRRVPLNLFDWEAFGLMLLMFGVEHLRFVAGVLAGLVYLGVMLKTRDIWAAVIAHVITNLMLGIYVLRSGYYAFW